MIANRPTELQLTIAPDRRVEVIDVNARIAQEAGDMLGRHQRVLYCSPHTTAGYLEQDFAGRLQHCRDRLSAFIGAFDAVFPEGGGYRHDHMALRSDLTEAQKQVEPRNGDSHLTYIGAGVRNCVTYRTSHVPVYFIDLDGTSAVSRRRRVTSILGYDRERIVARMSFTVPVAADGFDAVNLGDPRFGVLAQIDERLASTGLEHGRVDVALALHERHAGLTVNEYETLLMRHDLMDAFRNPLHFDRMSHRLNQSRGISLPALRCAAGARVVRGTYQSPILVQWQPAPEGWRRIDVTVVELSCDPVSSLVVLPCQTHISH